MDDDDFEHLFGAPEIERDADSPPADPDFRITVVGRRITAISWMPCLMNGPGAGSAFREREADGVTVADLTADGAPGEREAVVTWLARGGGPEAERLLAKWAHTVGFSRVWFPDRVVTFPRPAAVTPVKVRCRGCGHEFETASPQFWADVRQSGRFPSWCLLCGHDLPQWRVSRR